MASISTLVDRVKIFVNSSGTGPFVLGAAVPAFRGVEALQDGATYSYAVENGSNYEAGTCEYISSLGQLVRTPVISSNGGAVVAFPAGVQVAFTALAQDLVATGGTSPIIDSLGPERTAAASQRATTAGIEAAIGISENLRSDLAGPGGADLIGLPDGRTVEEAIADASQPEQTRWTYEAYGPGITRVDIDVGSGLYRHVPSIVATDGDNLLGAYLYNNSSASESAPGQTAGIIRSSDGGDNWSVITPELNLSDYSNNPLSPPAIQGEVFVAFDVEAVEEVATVAHRGSAYLSNYGFVSFRQSSTGQKWTNYRVIFDANNQPALSETVTGTPAAGFKGTYTLDAKEYEVVPFKPCWGRTGELVIPVILVVSFSTDMRVGFLIRRDGLWSMGGVVPLGVLDPESNWEPTTWQADDGTWYCQCRNNTGAGGTPWDNHAISASSDLMSWIPFTWLNEDVHVNRRIGLRDGLWVGCGTSHNTNRNALSLTFSQGGHEWVHGYTIGDERDGLDWSQYSDITVKDGFIHCIYSETVDYAIDPGVNTILYARVPVPTALPLMGSRKNQYQLDTGTAPSVAGSILAIPPRMMGSVVGGDKSFVLNLRFRVTSTPNSNRYRIISVGDAQLGYFTVEYVNSGGDCQLRVAGQTVRVEPDPTEWRTLTVIVDRERRVASCEGVIAPIGWIARCYLGDVQIAGGNQAGNIEYDADGFGLRQYDRIPETFLPARLPQSVGSLVSYGDVIAEGPVSGTSSFRHRVGGSTRAVRFWTDSESALVDQVGGSRVIQSTSAGTDILRNFGFGSGGSPLVITAGAITPTKAYHFVDTEGAASSDDLTNIAITKQGDMLTLRLFNGSRIVTIKEGGNIRCGADCPLSFGYSIITLFCTGSEWIVMSYREN